MPEQIAGNLFSNWKPLPETSSNIFFPIASAARRSESYVCRASCRSCPARSLL